MSHFVIGLGHGRGTNLALSAKGHVPGVTKPNQTQPNLTGF